MEQTPEQAPAERAPQPSTAIGAPARGGEEQRAPQPAAEAKAEPLAEDLGEVSGMPGFQSLIGELIDRHIPEEGTKKALSADAIIVFPITPTVDGNIAAKLTIDLWQAGGNTNLEGALSLSLGAEVDLIGASLGLGVTIRGHAKASGDSGEECMALLGLAALPQIESLSERLAGLLYGDTVAYSADVLAGMDTVEDGSEADTAELGFSAELNAGVKVDMGELDGEASLGVGYRRRSGVSASKSEGEERALQRSKSEGVTFDAAFEVGDFNAAVAMDASAGTFSLSAQAPVTDPTKLSWAKTLAPIITPLVVNGLAKLKGESVDTDELYEATLQVFENAAAQDLNLEAAPPVKNALLHVDLTFIHGEPTQAGLRVWLTETDTRSGTELFGGDKDEGKDKGKDKDKDKDKKHRRLELSASSKLIKETLLLDLPPTAVK